jgi:hypothetical protein
VSRKFTFVALHDPRGDLNLVSAAAALARRRDVGAGAVFLLGELVGPLLGKFELEKLQEARVRLLQEFAAHLAEYREQGIENAWHLAEHVLANPERYRRTGELEAAGTIRTLLGIPGKGGRMEDLGVAGERAASAYRRVTQILSETVVPYYVMADTVVAEHVLPERVWLHYHWLTLSGHSIASFGTPEPTGPESVREYAVGPRRKGILMKTNDYPYFRADVLLTHEPTPFLKEVTAKSSHQLVVLGGDGVLELDERENVLASQSPGAAYFYALHGTAVERRVFRYENGAYVEAAVEKPAHPSSGSGIFRVESRRAELETKLKLAGVGGDLLTLLDLIRRDDPGLAKRIERASNRAEAIFGYLQHLETRFQVMMQLLSAERAGLERILNQVLPYLSEADRARLVVALSKRPDLMSSVEQMDATNVEISKALAEGLAEKFGPPPA